MRTFLILAAALVPLSVPAVETLCKPVVSTGEGHRPIPEFEFTKAEAERALHSLSEQVERGTLEADFVTFENNLMRVRGYLLRLYAEKGGKSDVEAFCEFIKNEAYLHH